MKKPNSKRVERVVRVGDSQASGWRGWGSNGPERPRVSEGPLSPCPFGLLNLDI